MTCFRESGDDNFVIPHSMFLSAYWFCQRVENPIYKTNHYPIANSNKRIHSLVFIRWMLSSILWRIAGAGLLTFRCFISKYSDSVSARGKQMLWVHRLRNSLPKNMWKPVWRHSSSLPCAIWGMFLPKRHSTAWWEMHWARKLSLSRGRGRLQAWINYC